MTKKHYQAIAVILLHHKKCIDSGFEPKQTIAHDLADYFTTDNPRFDRSRFLEACGIEIDNNNGTDTCHYPPECKKQIIKF